MNFAPASPPPHAPARGKPRSPTLTRRLLAWALGTLVVVWLGFVLVGYRTGVHEADELTDGHLASTAALLLNLQDAQFVSAGQATARVSLPSLKSHDYQQSLSVAIRDGAGRLIGSAGEAPVPPFSAAEGFADLYLGTPPGRWRSFTQWSSARDRVVTVMLDVRERDDLASDIAEQLAEPGLWLLPVVMLTLGLAIWRGLRPLYRLSQDVARLDAGRAQRLPAAHALREFESVVASINNLLANQQAALERERELASEVAHELRTPLSSISLQAQALGGPLAPDERERALGQIGRDALHAGHVLAQVLTLARASRAELDEAAADVDLGELARRVAGDYAQRAWQLGDELGVSGPAALAVRGHAPLLELALRNLVENALKHTPGGTRIDIQLGRDASGPWIQVCDDGPGAGGPAPRPSTGGASPPGEGLGLGLKIVARVADVHGARCGWHAAPGPFGNCYRLAFGPSDEAPSG